MGSKGISIRTRVTKIINDKNKRSVLTLTPKTVTIGDKGGYEQNTEVDGTNQEVYCIPANYVKSMVNPQVMGLLKEGEIRFLIKYDEVFDTDDEITFESAYYHIRMIKPIFFNEETIAQSITLSRKLD